MSRSLFFGVFLVSAASLGFQVVLARFFSIVLGYHFAFMVLSLALFGFAASGVALRFLSVDVSETMRVLRAASLLFCVSLVFGYLIQTSLLRM